MGEGGGEGRVRVWVEGAVCIVGFCWRCPFGRVCGGGGDDGFGDCGGRGAPSGHGLGTALSVFVEWGGMCASDVVDFVADLDEVDGCVCSSGVIGAGTGVGGVVEDVGVDHEADFWGQTLEEAACWLGGAVCCCGWYDVVAGCGCRWRTAYLTRLNQFANGFWPSFACGIVVEDGVGVAEDPGVEVAHFVYFNEYISLSSLVV